jgi:methionine synthase I (cobalamin-dependent)
MIKNVAVLFYLKKRTNSNEEKVPVYVRITCDGQRAELATGQKIQAFSQVVQQLGIQGVSVKLVSKVVANIMADEGEQWDEIVLVDYPSAEAFITIAQSDVYRQIADPLRVAGTAELKLFMTRKIDF